MLRLLLIAATAYGAAIPSSPSCLERCLVTGGVVGAAADLNFFKSVAVDYNNFCSVYDSLLKCASECSSADLALVTKHTTHAAWACKEKTDAFKSFHDCLESDATDPLTDCAKTCAVVDHLPLRLDSTATAPVNPNTPMDGAPAICEKQMCVLKCSRILLNKQCAGSGDLFKEMARHQVEMGWQDLRQNSENANDTQTQLAALSYLSNIPEKCMYLTSLEAFDKQVVTEMEKNKDMNPIDFSNDTSVETVETPSASVDSPVLPPSTVDAAPTATTPIAFHVDEPSASVDSPSATASSSSDAPSLDDTQFDSSQFVPRGKPSNETVSDESAEGSAAVPVQDEEEVKIIGQPQPDSPHSHETAPIASAIDGAPETADKDSSMHEQPAPSLPPTVAEPSVTTAASTDSKEVTAPLPAAAASDDSEAAMGTRPTTDAGTGLIPDGPVSSADRDSEEDESTSDGATPPPVSIPAIGETDSKSKEAVEGGSSMETSTAMNTDSHEATTVEQDKGSVDEQQDASPSVEAKDSAEKEDVEGPGQMHMDASTAVVDTSDASMVDTNKVEPATHGNGVSSSTVVMSCAVALSSLLLL